MYTYTYSYSYIHTHTCVSRAHDSATPLATPVAQV